MFYHGRCLGADCVWLLFPRASRSGITGMRSGWFGVCCNLLKCVVPHSPACTRALYLLGGTRLFGYGKQPGRFLSCVMLCCCCGGGCLGTDFAVGGIGGSQFIFFGKLALRSVLLVWWKWSQLGLSQAQGVSCYFAWFWGEGVGHVSVWRTPSWSWVSEHSASDTSGNADS